MNREQQEMALWREAYRDSHCFLAQERAGGADAAVEQFRLRYPAEPATAKAVWYDEPPFARDGKSYPCWVDGEEHPVLVAMYSRWEYKANDDDGCWLPLNGRRVCPIVKPQEPTQ